MFTGCLSGAFSLVTVHQPAVLSAALGQDIIMPCELRLQDEKLLSQPILYWWKLNEMAADFIRLIPSQTPNNSRATLLDNNGMSTNKSMILKSVQWADSGKYRCKLSLHTERNGNFRQKGDTTSLVVYGKYKAEDLLFFLFIASHGRPNVVTFHSIHIYWLLFCRVWLTERRFKVKGQGLDYIRPCQEDRTALCGTCTWTVSSADLQSSLQKSCEIFALSMEVKNTERKTTRERRPV